MRYVSCGQVLEVVKNSTGSIRLRLDEDRGWMSYKDHLVVRLDDEGNPIEKMKPKPKNEESSMGSYKSQTMKNYQLSVGHPS